METITAFAATCAENSPQAGYTLHVDMRTKPDGNPGGTFAGPFSVRVIASDTNPNAPRLETTIPLVSYDAGIYQCAFPSTVSIKTSDYVQVILLDNGVATGFLYTLQIPSQPALPPPPPPLQPPAFLSGNRTTVIVGQAFTFQVVASFGATITANTLPAGVTFVNGTLSGTIATASTPAIVFTATNAAGNAVQAFTMYAVSLAPIPPPPPPAPVGYIPLHRDARYLIRDFTKLNGIQKSAGGTYRVWDIDFINVQTLSMAQAATKCRELVAVATADLNFSLQYRTRALQNEEWTAQRDATFTAAMSEIARVIDFAVDEVQNQQKFNLVNPQLLKSTR